MTKPSETLWEIEPHTKAKHEILHRYLGAWFPILGSKIPRIVYMDGFCGPGKYIGGEDGSPIIALKEALNQPALRNSDVIFLFIDDRPDRIEHLKAELSLLKIPNNFHVHPEVNEFETTLIEILDKLERDGNRLAPTFAFIDPFGFKGAPFNLVRRLLKNHRTEVFINIMVESINRFIEHPSDAVRQHIKDLLDATDEEINRVLDAQDRILAFRELYQEKLRSHAKFVRFFEMRDYRNKVIYYLFFASNHPLGHTRIKEAFWKVDNQNGYKFSDQTDPNQLVLFESEPFTNLANLLRDHFSEHTLSTDEIFSYVENETAYISSQARRALIQLEDNREISVEPVKSDGNKRIKSTFPPGVIIHF